MESNKKQHRTQPSLPDDIIFVEILPKVSLIKSLLRFKCVSKSWCSFISTKSFAKTHLTNTVKNTCHNQYKTLFISRDENINFVINHCPLGSFFSHTEVARLVFDYPMDRYGYGPEIVGCCDGLFCICMDNKYFVLWNPSTKMSHKLPPVFDHSFSLYLNGFGYDEPNDDYKVLVRLNVPPAVSRLYSLKTNSWKTVDAFHGRDDCLGPVVVVNGKLHWGVKKARDEVSFKIESFDLGSENAGVIEQPSSVDGKWLYPTVGVLEDCLCVFCDTRNGSTDVWVMKEYGVKESWCKVVNVPYSSGRIERDPPLPFRILCISEEGEILLSKDSLLIVYNPETNSRRYSPLKYILGRRQMGFYIESLVSPLPDV